MDVWVLQPLPARPAAARGLFWKNERPAGYMHRPRVASKILASIQFQEI